MSPMARSFYAESKRVSNRRIHEELGIDLAYPTYREGLRALLKALTSYLPAMQTRERRSRSSTPTRAH